MLSNGQRVENTGRYFPGLGTVLAAYSSPMGPSYLVKLDSGREMAIMARDLRAA